jgi:hypothetical protein
MGGHLVQQLDHARWRLGHLVANELQRDESDHQPLLRALVELVGDGLTQVSFVVGRTSPLGDVALGGVVEPDHDT